MWRLLIVLIPHFAFAFPNFETFQGSKSSKWKKLKEEDIQDIRFYKKLFEKNFTVAAFDGTRIPEVVHFIWLGPNSFPQESIKNVSSWKELHPDWTFKFWTDDPERPCPLPGMEKHLISELELPYLGTFLERTNNWGERSDMLRYEILFKEGGVYVDHDVTCYRSFSALNPVYDFYACLEAPHPAEGQKTQIFACNCVIGSIPNHPIFESMMEKIVSRWDNIEAAHMNETSRVLHRTFLSFTEAVREGANSSYYRNILFPAYFFFPDQVYSTKTQKKLNLEGQAFASHSFAGLWTDDPPNEVKEFKAKFNEQLKKINHRIRRLYYLLVCAMCFIAFLLFLQFKPSRS